MNSFERGFIMASRNVHQSYFGVHHQKTNHEAKDATIETDDEDENEDPVPLSSAQKRKQQDDHHRKDMHSEASPNLKRKDDGVKKDKGVLVGTLNRPEMKPDLEQPAVYGSIDTRYRLRLKTHHETREGANLSGRVRLGSYTLSPKLEDIKLESHLCKLDWNELREYVTIKLQAPKEEKSGMQQSETDFVLEAIKRAAHKARTSFVPTKKRKIMDENDYSSPTKKVAAGASISVPIGYWADSDALLSIDKHAVHGVSHEDGRFGVKVMNHTRDGRPQHGNYPDAPRKMWIAFQKCALNFDLRHLDYLGVKEYCRLRRISLLNGETEDQRPAAEAEAISMAETFVSDTFAAENMGVPKSSAADSKRDAVHGLKREKKPDMGFNRQDTTPSPRTTYENGTKRTLPSSPASYAGFQKDASRPDITPLSREGHTQFEVPRESEFKENLAGTESEKDDGDDTKQGKRSQSNTRRSAEPTPKNPCSSDNGLDEEEEKLVDCNGVSYERKKSGPLSGKLVGDKREVFSINGQDYVEYRVLMKVVF